MDLFLRAESQHLECGQQRALAVRGVSNINKGVLSKSSCH